ncbi:hypothetical protein [Lysobacter sp. GCM10012299]
MSLSYELIDGQTGHAVASYPTLRIACSAADRRNAAHGGIRFTVEAVLA